MILSLKRTDYALDIGSTRVRVFEAGKGVVLDVPVEDLVDVASVLDRGERLAAVCRAAFVRVGARRRFVSYVKRVLLSMPSSASEVQKLVCEDAARHAGAPEVILIESPMAAAIGAGEEVCKTQATAVVDVGASRIQAEGIPFSPRRAWLLNAAKARECDLLIGMDDYNIADLHRLVYPEDAGKIRKLLSFAGAGRDIADPWYTGNFDQTYADVLEGCTALLEHLDGRNTHCAAS